MIQLKENEAKTLKALEGKGGNASLEDIIGATSLDHSAAMRALLSLSASSLVETSKKDRRIVVLTEEGTQSAAKGLPERRLVEAAVAAGGRAVLSRLLDEAGIEESFLPVALGWIRRKNWATLADEEGQRVLHASSTPGVGLDEQLLKFLAGSGRTDFQDIPPALVKEIGTLQKRGLLEMEQKALISASLTERGWNVIREGILVAQEVSSLTPELIASGRWREVSLSKYNIDARPLKKWPGKKQPYRRFLDDLKTRLVSLGFIEMEGPTVELMFFNCDALFMPQDHPAREIHDIYFVKNPKFGTLNRYATFLRKVKLTHQNGWKTGSSGWGYTYNTEDAKRLVLRSHGTALSARMLVSEQLEIPGKYFSTVRCYRPEFVDRTHLTEFNQVEGIVAGEGLTLRDLLGVLERFAIDIAGASSVKFNPDYFPFTEPSVELVAYKKGYGWLEFGGSGIFRPELTKPLGVEVPVIAWGLGVDRLYMMKEGIGDMRKLFTLDLDWMRRKELA